MQTYAHPETLVSTAWTAEHATDPEVRIVEVDVDTKAYDEGHVPGAIAWAWNSQLCDTVRRDILSKQQFEELMASSGITPATTLVIYGDNNNWFAAWAFWQAKIYGHSDVRLMNGGRKKWLAEGRELATGTPQVKPAHYQAAEPDLSLRAFLPQVQAAVSARIAGLVDVRSPQEFSGEILAPPGTARNLPARRTHSGRAQHPVGQGLQRGRHLQIGRRAAPALRRRRHRRLAAGDRLLPHRRAFQP
jgi:thiosulfate/3-mercaptopyruvate sulfurtransferase